MRVWDQVAAATANFRFRLKTTDELRVWWKLWSIQLGIVGTAITGWLIAFPDQALELWFALPDTIRAYIPEKYMPFVGLFVFVLSMLSKFIKQHKVAAELAAKKAEDIAAEKAKLIAEGH